MLLPQKILDAFLIGSVYQPNSRTSINFLRLYLQIGEVAVYGESGSVALAAGITIKPRSKLDIRMCWIAGTAACRLSVSLPRSLEKLSLDIPRHVATISQLDPSRHFLTPTWTQTRNFDSALKKDFENK